MNSGQGRDTMKRTYIGIIALIWVVIDMTLYFRFGDSSAVRTALAIGSIIVGLTILYLTFRAKRAEDNE
jgi:hypothetical protein